MVGTQSLHIESELVVDGFRQMRQACWAGALGVAGTALSGAGGGACTVSLRRGCGGGCPSSAFAGTCAFAGAIMSAQCSQRDSLLVLDISVQIRQALGAVDGVDAVDAVDAVGAVGNSRVSFVSRVISGIVSGIVLGVGHGRVEIHGLGASLEEGASVQGGGMAAGRVNWWLDMLLQHRGIIKTGGDGGDGDGGGGGIGDDDSCVGSYSSVYYKAV